MWTQIVGKIALGYSPRVNHWWECAFCVTPVGLTTLPLAYGQTVFQLEFDFLNHLLTARLSNGRHRSMALVPKTVADFYIDCMALMRSLGIPLKINPLPQEFPNPIRFDQDQEHYSYDRESVRRCLAILVQSDRLFRRFRADFVGKSSPVQFFWGSFDLNLSLFSGRRAPDRPGADAVTREAYSHELMSVGFWPGSGNIPDPAFYAYAAPEPEGFTSASIRPKGAFYNPPTHGFVLMYEEVRKSEDPDRTVLEFIRSTYEAASELGHWDRSALERQPSRRAA